MKIRILKADFSHAYAIASIGKRAFHAAFRSVFNRPEDLIQYLNRTYSAEKIATSLLKPNNIFLLAMVENKPAGFAKVKLQSPNKLLQGENHMELQKIYVLKEYLGTGVGARLMNTVLEISKELKPDYLWLDVLIGNERATRFYQKYGFTFRGNHSFKIGTQAFQYDVMSLAVLTKVEGYVHLNS